MKYINEVNVLDLFGGTISSLENGLSYATLNHKTIANNIANVDTPNYKAKNVSFKDMLEKEQQMSISAYRTDSRHYDFEIRQSTPNAVDMDAEQAKLAENQIYYNALIERMNGKLNTLNTVIKGGK